jgi:hypothetical protein
MKLRAPFGVTIKPRPGRTLSKYSTRFAGSAWA